MQNLFKPFRFLCALAVFTAYIHGQQPMPGIQGESLSGKNVSLPDAAKGHVAVLVFGFTKKSKEPTSAWAGKLNSDFAAQADFDIYQIPVLEDVPHFIRGMVISGMKKGVKENLRDHFVPIVRGEAELKKLVGYKEPDDAYLVILDPEGNIAGQMHGPFSDTMYEQLHNQIQMLLHR